MILQKFMQKKEKKSPSYSHTLYNNGQTTSDHLAQLFRAFFRSEKHYNPSPLPYMSTSCPTMLNPTYENLIGAFLYHSLQPQRSFTNVKFSYTDTHIYLYTQSTTQLSTYDSIPSHLEKELELHKPLLDLLGIPQDPQHFIVYPSFTTEELQIAPQQFFYHSPSFSDSSSTADVDNLKKQMQLSSKNILNALEHIKQQSVADSNLHTYVIHPLENIFSKYVKQTSTDTSV